MLNGNEETAATMVIEAKLIALETGTTMVNIMINYSGSYIIAQQLYMDSSNGTLMPSIPIVELAMEWYQ